MEPPEKRLRPRLSTTDEERIACNAGRFEQADECGDDEREALPPGVDEKVWCTIRNSIVARWLQDVSRPMTADAACSAFVERYHPLARTVLAWLHAHGHVNYGLLAAAPWAVEPSKPSVLIIGAGLAGLAAARALLSFGHAVAVVEARDRPGGRVHTVRLGEGGGGVTGAAELGGAVLTGCDANPLAVLARQLDARLHAVRDRCPLFDDQGAPVPRERDACVERRFNGLLDACGAFRNDVGAAADSVSLGRALHMFAPEAGFGDDCPAEERALLNWHVANLEYANAACVADLSLGSWDQDDEWEMGGDHSLLPGGNLRLVAALAQDVPVFYGCAATRVEHGAAGVAVHCSGPAGGAPRTFCADVALLTLPLGVLKQGSVAFDPPLPADKQAAIDSLGFGILNKCVMLFDAPFWDTDCDTFGRCAGPGEPPGLYFMFYATRLTPTDEGALLVGLVAGAAARTFESAPPAESLAHCLQVLRSIHGAAAVPQPRDWAVTAWGSDPWARGSYSHLPVGATGAAYDALAAPCGPLHWAGEATARRYPATLHGALLSGLREAGRITTGRSRNARRVAQAQPRPRAAPPPPPPQQQPQQPLPSQTQQPAAGPAAKCEADWGAVLGVAFGAPDWEFGAFALVLPQPGAPPDAPCLLQVQLGRLGRETSRNTVAVYLALAVFDGLRLRDEPGGDAERVALLATMPGGKLIGRSGLPPAALALGAVRAAAAQAARVPG